MINAAGEGLGALGIGCCCGWLYALLSITQCADTGVIEGIDVDGQSLGVLGEVSGTPHHSVAEA